MVRVRQRVLDQTQWPELRARSAELAAHLGEVTERVIAEAIRGDATEAPEVPAVVNAK